MIGEAPLGLRHLRYFATVARERNFTRAVEKLQCERSLLKFGWLGVGMKRCTAHSDTRMVLRRVVECGDLDGQAS
jgi:hypothetical protein